MIIILSHGFSYQSEKEQYENLIVHFNLIKHTIQRRPTRYDDEVNRISCSDAKLRLSSNMGGLLVYDPFDGSNDSINNFPMAPGPIRLF